MEPNDEFAPDFLAYLDKHGVYFIYGPNPFGPVATGSLDLADLNWIKYEEAPDETSMLDLGHEPIPVEVLILAVDFAETANQILTFCE